MKDIPITVSLLLAAATLAFSPSSAGEPAGAVPPDFTAGGKKDDSHDWLLGPTGLRGWMFFRHEDLTAASRQILVTAVDKGSPADGIVQVNDVILGVFGQPFADDASSGDFSLPLERVPRSPCACMHPTILKL